MDDLYEALGVKKDASQEEIKRAYKKKAKKAHPDREGGSASAMVEINRAYEVLGDAEKRAQYDQTGSLDRPPTLEECAMQSVAKAFDDMLADGAPQGNIVSLIVKAIQQALKRNEVEIKKIDSYLAGLEKKACLVSKKSNDGIDLWSSIVDARRKRYETAKTMTLRDLEVAKVCLEILDGYAGVDVPEATKPKDVYATNWAKQSSSLFGD